MDSNGSGSPPVGLGLALGCGSTGGGGVDQYHRPTPAASSGYTKTTASNFGFTILQLQEFQLQSVIYKYIEAGCPVPQNLILPIWKSFSSLNSSLFQLYPSFMGAGELNLKFSNKMDPEPGRCRRTDGKKWRCSKEALPNQKYCERHMHRGRHSRKLVEPAATTATTTTAANTNLSISLPAVSSNSTTNNSTLYPMFSF